MTYLKILFLAVIYPIDHVYCCRERFSQTATLRDSSMNNLQVNL